jgi:hypothetical protein
LSIFSAPDATALCQKLQSFVDGQDVQVAAVYQAAAAAKALNSCSLKLSAAASKVIK